MEIFEAASHIKDDDTRLEFLLDFLERFYHAAEEPYRRKMTKTAVTKLLSVYTSDKYESDIRLLRAWELLALTSTTIGYSGIMKRIDDLGYYRNCLEFYQLWAANCIKENDRRTYATIQEKAESNGIPRSYFTHVFAPEKDEDEIEHGETEHVFLCRTPLKKPLSAVHEEEPIKFSPASPENAPVSMTSAPLRKPLSAVNGEEPIKFSHASPEDAPVPMTSAPLRKPLSAVHEEPIKLSPAYPQDVPISVTSAPLRKPLSAVNEEEPIKPSPTPVAPIVTPPPKTAPTTTSSAPPGNFSFTTYLQMDACDAFGATLPFSQNDDPTVAGMETGSSSRSVSTPNGGRAQLPTFEVSPTASFPMANQPFTFAPSAASAARPMIFGDAPANLDETTHDISIMPETDIKSGVNPWCETERSRILKEAPPMVEQHEFCSTRCPSFNQPSVSLGGETFKILKFIAQGGFAKIYRTEGEDGKQYAVKLEMPSCPWEVYICKSLSARLPQAFQHFVMTIRDAYIFSNASAIVYDYYPLRTLLDLTNAYKAEKSNMDGLLTGFIGAQIAQTLQYVHQSKIIHADVKPDNFVIVSPMATDLPSTQYYKPFIKLIDFGRAIDMSCYPETQTFTGRAGTHGFDCPEMQENRPWTYQTDFFGYVGTIHVLMFGTYMKTYYRTSRYSIVEVIKRRYPLYSAWVKIFNDFLNIPACDQLPEWEKVVSQLKDDLNDFAGEDVAAWKRAVDKCNSLLRQIAQ